MASKIVTYKYLNTLSGESRETSKLNKCPCLGALTAAIQNSGYYLNLYVNASNATNNRLLASSRISLKTTYTARVTFTSTTAISNINVIYVFDKNYGTPTIGNVVNLLNTQGGAINAIVKGNNVTLCDGQIRMSSKPPVGQVSGNGTSTRVNVAWNSTVYVYAISNYTSYWFTGKIECIQD